MSTDDNSTPAPEPQFVIVDVESNGLNRDRHIAVEVAWWNLSTGDRDTFVPYHSVSQALAEADIKALQINRYIDRIAAGPQDLSGKAAIRLSEVLYGNTLAGSNPSFDRDMLWKMFRVEEKRRHDDFLDPIPEIHHRMWDLSAYAAGVLGLDHLPGLSEVCELLGTGARPDHSANADVSATGEAFLMLFERAGIAIPGASAGVA